MSEWISGVLREESDSSLVAATKKGESRAFEFLVKRHESRIFAVAFKITRNREDAQDVVQQSFYKAYAHLDTFKGESSFSTWLTRIAMNEAFMCLRKNRTRNEVSLEHLQSGPEAPFPMEIRDTGENPAAIYRQYEKQRILSQAMVHLSSELRATLFLRLEGRTIKETAEIMGVGIVTLKSRLFRARKKLRILFARGPEFPRGRATYMMRKRCDLNANSHLPISAVSCG
jgi:RNA polymerase sigma-70 factor (ECF subfamily)